MKITTFDTLIAQIKRRLKKPAWDAQAWDVLAAEEVALKAWNYPVAKDMNLLEKNRIKTIKYRILEHIMLAMLAALYLFIGLVIIGSISGCALPVTEVVAKFIDRVPLGWQ